MTQTEVNMHENVEKKCRKNQSSICSRYSHGFVYKLLHVCVKPYRLYRLSNCIYE